jgi:tRNA G10  N-methylase Trm11
VAQQRTLWDEVDEVLSGPSPSSDSSSLWRQVDAVLGEQPMHPAKSTVTSTPGPGSSEMVLPDGLSPLERDTVLRASSAFRGPNRAAMVPPAPPPPPEVELPPEPVNVGGRGTGLDVRVSDRAAGTALHAVSGVLQAPVGALQSVPAAVGEQLFGQDLPGHQGEPQTIFGRAAAHLGMTARGFGGAVVPTSAMTPNPPDTVAMPGPDALTAMRAQVGYQPPLPRTRTGTERFIEELSGRGLATAAKMLQDPAFVAMGLAPQDAAEAIAAVNSAVGVAAAVQTASDPRASDVDVAEATLNAVFASLPIGYRMARAAQQRASQLASDFRTAAEAQAQDNAAYDRQMGYGFENAKPVNPAGEQFRTDRALPPETQALPPAPEPGAPPPPPAAPPQFDVDAAIRDLAQAEPNSPAARTALAALERAGVPLDDATARVRALQTAAPGSPAPAAPRSPDVWAEVDQVLDEGQAPASKALKDVQERRLTNVGPPPGMTDRRHDELLASFAENPNVTDASRTAAATGKARADAELQTSAKPDLDALDEWIAQTDPDATMDRKTVAHAFERDFGRPPDENELDAMIGTGDVMQLPPVGTEYTLNGRTYRVRSHNDTTKRFPSIKGPVVEDITNPDRVREIQTTELHLIHDYGKAQDQAQRPAATEPPTRLTDEQYDDKYFHLQDLRDAIGELEQRQAAGERLKKADVQRLTGLQQDLARKQRDGKYWRTIDDHYEPLREQLQAKGVEHLTDAELDRLKIAQEAHLRRHGRMQALLAPDDDPLMEAIDAEHHWRYDQARQQHAPIELTTPIPKAGKTFEHGGHVWGVRGSSVSGGGQRTAYEAVRLVPEKDYTGEAPVQTDDEYMKRLGGGGYRFGLYDITDEDLADKAGLIQHVEDSKVADRMRGRSTGVVFMHNGERWIATGESATVYAPEPVKGGKPAPPVKEKKKRAETPVSAPPEEGVAAPPAAAPPSAAVPEKPAPPVVARPAGGPVFSATLYQGRGATPREIYGSDDGVPIFGAGHYYAHTAKHAERYAGKQGAAGVTSHRVELRNPLVIENNRQWGDLLRAADALALHSTDGHYAKDQNKPAAAKRLQAHVRGLGHDGVIIKNTDTEKRLRESFGHDQVVVFGESAAAAAKPAPPVTDKAPAAAAKPAPPVADKPTPDVLPVRIYRIIKERNFLEIAKDARELRKMVAVALANVTVQELEQNIDDVNDAAEAAVIDKFNPAGGWQSAMKAENLVPRAHRTLEKMKLQQFSTPLPIAVMAAAAADVRPGDVVLEPTAGTGNLLAPLKDRTDITRLAIEMSERRAALLRAQGYDVTRGDYLATKPAEQPTVIISNPPWGKYTTGKYGKAVGLDFTPADVAERFVAKMMRDLADNGRLAVVMPTTMLNSPSFKHWLRSKFTVQAIIQSPADAYRTRSTDVESLLLVVDKVERPYQSVSYGLEKPKLPAVVVAKDWEDYARLVSELPARQEVKRDGSRKPQQPAAAAGPDRSERPERVSGPAPGQRLAEPGRDTAVRTERPADVVGPAGVETQPERPAGTAAGEFADVVDHTADERRAAAGSRQFAPYTYAGLLSGASGILSS